MVAPPCAVVPGRRVRLWSLHPRYLDTAGLTAGWREALLAQKVLTGVTRGYRHHPQLERFLPGSALAAELGPGHGVSGGVPRVPRAATGRDAVDGTAAGGPPGDRIVGYLHALADEADARGYRYDRSRIAGPRCAVVPLEVTEGQLQYEWGLLRAKLARRSPDVLARWAGVAVAEPFPGFVVVPGPVAAWERV